MSMDKPAIVRDAIRDKAWSGGCRCPTCVRAHVEILVRRIENEREEEDKDLRKGR